jgi:ribose transport system permease protein
MSARMRLFLSLYGTALGCLGVALFFAIAADNFLSLGNIFTILRQVSFLVILATGFTFALIASELDLSFAAVASLAGVAAGGLIHAGYPWPLGVLAALLLATLFGVINGVLVTRFKIPSLIATLATASIATGIGFAMTKGVAWVGRWDPAFTGLGRGFVAGIPVLALWAGAVVALAWFAVAQTRFGAWLIATGEAAEAARLAGIPVARMKLMGLALSGVCAGIGAVLLTASLSSAGPNGAADFLMKGIAAALLGMTMFEPGRPSVAGTLVGSLVIGILANGLVLMGAPYYVQDITLGIIILLSVAISASALTKAAFSL